MAKLFLSHEDRRRFLVSSAILIVLYILLGNARSIQPNPFIPGAIIAINMIVPVLAGILFGPWCGLVVGLGGTFINSFTPAGSSFELLATLPHGLMGFVAGKLVDRAPTPVPSMALAAGHLGNIAMYVAFGLMKWTEVANARFWYGLLTEFFVGMVAVSLIAALYHVAFDPEMPRNAAVNPS